MIPPSHGHCDCVLGIYSAPALACNKHMVLLPSPSSYCSLNDRPTDRDMSCWDKEQRLYLESQQMEKMVN